MKKVLVLVGCLLVIAAAIALRSELLWLPATLATLLLLFFTVNFFGSLFGKDPTPEELADRIERLLNGNLAGPYEVDDFESGPLRDPRLQEVRHRCLCVGLPETWPSASEDQKAALRQIIEELRRH